MRYYNIFIASSNKLFTWSSKELLTFGDTVLVPYRSHFVHGMVVEEIAKPLIITREIIKNMHHKLYPIRYKECLDMQCRSSYLTLGQMLECTCRGVLQSMRKV